MSVRSLNKVQLIGNLTRDPELRYTPQGTAVCTLGLATNREWTDQNGQKQEETEFHRIVAWHKLGELCSQLLFKGRKVYVEGRLQTRKWTSQDNQERQATEVVIDNMIILDSRRKEGEEGASFTPAPAKVTMPAPAAVADDQGGAAPTDTPMAPPPAKKKAAGKAPKSQDETAVVETKAEPVAKIEANSEEVKADDIPF